MGREQRVKQEWCAREEDEFPVDQFETIGKTRLHKLVAEDSSESFHRATDGIEVEVKLKHEVKARDVEERQRPPQPPGFVMGP